VNGAVSLLIDLRCHFVCFSIMSVELSLRRISPELVKALQDFGELAFDLFWESDLVEEEDSWTEGKIDDEYFSGDKSEFQNFPRDLMLSILSEGCEIFRSLDRSLWTNGNFTEGIHFLLSGKHQFHRNDFTVREVASTDNEMIALVNVLVGKYEIKNEPGLYASYLTSIEVKEAAKFLPKVLKDDFDLRWRVLQELDQGSEYLLPYYEDPRWDAEQIDSIQQWRRSFKERLQLPFSERFYPEQPRQFLQDELLPFLEAASHFGHGVISCRGY
jgi:hypothetical protein